MKSVRFSKHKIPDEEEVLYVTVCKDKKSWQAARAWKLALYASGLIFSVLCLLCCFCAARLGDGQANITRAAVD